MELRHLHGDGLGLRRRDAGAGFGDKRECDEQRRGGNTGETDAVTFNSSIAVDPARTKVALPRSTRTRS
jgi:hypothetical protein